MCLYWRVLNYVLPCFEFHIVCDWWVLHKCIIMQSCTCIHLPLLLYSQSELREHQSRLHDDTLDHELLLLDEDQELMAGAEEDAALLDSRTDDDLMLDMEEFL